MDLQVAVLKADPHDEDTHIYQIVFLGPYRSNVAPVPCNVQAQQQNLLCSKSFETSKLQSTVSKSCAKLLTQGCCFKVTFLLLVQQE